MRKSELVGQLAVTWSGAALPYPLEFCRAGEMLHIPELRQEPSLDDPTDEHTDAGP